MSRGEKLKTYENSRVYSPTKRGNSTGLGGLVLAWLLGFVCSWRFLVCRDFLFVGLVFACVFCCGFCCCFSVVWLGSSFHFSDIHQVSSQRSLHYRHEHSACQTAPAVTKVMICVSSNQKESKEVATDPLWKHRRHWFFLI